jgi:hypothetical protein
MTGTGHGFVSRILLAACFSAACASSQASTSGAAQAESAQEGVVKLADSNIEYFSEGKGDAVVLLPGGSLTVGYIEGLLHALAKAGYRAVRQQKTLHSRIGGHRRERRSMSSRKEQMTKPLLPKMENC